MNAHGGGSSGLGARLVVWVAAAALLGGCASRGGMESAAWDHVRETARHDVQLHRWPAGTELVVDVSSLDARDAEEVLRAFDAWLTEAPAPIRVRRASGGEAANVVFVETEEIDEGHESLGVTRLEHDGDRLGSATVELARTTRFGPRVTRLERRRTVLHEVGHVLGLGHSSRLSSIMHRETPGTSVDATDRAALRLLYVVRTVVATAPED